MTTRGRLRIFFGYSAGVGKTYAMLKTAQEQKRAGLDVVIGYLEPQERLDTLKMAENLETIPVRFVSYKGVLLKEFDLDAALARHPQLLLVDELAHTNAPGSKNPKRYLDVEEILNVGIDVFTTVNVQHIEGLRDIVGLATDVDVNERIPDEIFDYADEVTLVDIEPAELIERMKEGKIYQKTNASIALMNFFSAEHLSSLREMAMRRSADRVEKLSNNGQLLNKVLVLVSPSPSSAKNIRVAARMANAFHCAFSALYVESDSELSEESATNLRRNIQLVRDIGGEMIVKHSEDVVETAVDYVQLMGVSDLIIGKNWGRDRRVSNLENQVIARLPALEILIVPGDELASRKPLRPALLKRLREHFLFWSGSEKAQAKKVLATIDLLMASTQKNGDGPFATRLCEALSRAFERSCELVVGTETIISTQKGEDASFFRHPNEQAAVKWCREHKISCGRGTGILDNAGAIYEPLVNRKEVVAVIGFSCEKSKFDAFDVSLFYQILHYLDFIVDSQRPNLLDEC
jgi:two-component system, OmpR family, sensor histidine kinase KdpD